MVLGRKLPLIRLIFVYLWNKPCMIHKSRFGSISRTFIFTFDNFDFALNCISGPSWSILRRLIFDLASTLFSLILLPPSGLCWTTWTGLKQHEMHWYGSWKKGSPDPHDICLYLKQTLHVLTIKLFSIGFMAGLKAREKLFRFYLYLCPLGLFCAWLGF